MERKDYPELADGILETTSRKPAIKDWDFLETLLANHNGRDALLIALCGGDKSLVIMALTEKPVSRNEYDRNRKAVQEFLDSTVMVKYPPVPITDKGLEGFEWIHDLGELGSSMADDRPELSMEASQNYSIIHSLLHWWNQDYEEAMHIMSVSMMVNPDHKATNLLGKLMAVKTLDFVLGGE